MAYNITDENLLSLSLAPADEDEYEDDEIQRRHITIIGTWYLSELNNYTMNALNADKQEEHTLLSCS